MSSKTVGQKLVTAKIWDKISDPIIQELSIVSGESALSIAKCDGHQVATDPNEYAQRNWVTYYLATNTWLFQAREISERGCLELHEAILQKGLLPIIAECDRVANDFVKSYALDDNRQDKDIPPYLVYLLSACDDDRVALQMLRYLKRFSPDGADLILAESVKSLISCNSRCKDNNRKGFHGWASYRPNRSSSSPSRYWIEHIRDTLAEMLDGYHLDSTRGIFSTGVAADAPRPLAEKLSQYGMWECCLYKSPLYPISHGTRIAWEGESFSSSLFCAKVQAVPKSFKSARVIAEEHAYRQYYMQAIRMEIERCLKRNGYQDYLDLHSQVRNQEYADIGSRIGCYATIDLSSASDSVSRSLAYEVLPQCLVSDVDMYLPRTFSVERVSRTMHMFCTSGSAVTFPVESVIFLAIALAVREVASALTGEVFLPPAVFGDDIVVDVMLFDTVTEVLEQLGFVVNTTKSFGPGTLYRESCGSEYICGYDLKSRYWPRTTFVWSRKHLPTVIGQICALQHKLYGTFAARKFLALIVRSLEPRMTSHIAGTECVDLWESIPRFKVRRAPGLESCEDPRAEREVHLNLKTRYRYPSVEPTATGYNLMSLVEMWRYSTFLRLGPTFDGELERLLGVSSKNSPLHHDCVDGETFWGYTAE
jgi:hypothetical protein